MEEEKRERKVISMWMEGMKRRGGCFDSAKVSRGERKGDKPGRGRKVLETQRCEEIL